jgi:hypothetical protein
MCRKAAASILENERARIVQIRQNYPVEIQSGEDVTPEMSFRAVIATPRELDVLIAQLRAESVSVEEALNPTLVR